MQKEFTSNFASFTLWVVGVAISLKGDNYGVKLPPSYLEIFSNVS
jgi:hypothetical protein